MSFYLNIESSKDIDELHINFSDGSSNIVTKPKSNTKEPKQVRKTQKVQRIQPKKEEFLDLDSPVESDIIEKPVIEQNNRPIKVADELQNLDI